MYCSFKTSNLAAWQVWFRVTRLSSIVVNNITTRRDIDGIVRWCGEGDVFFTKCMSVTRRVKLWSTNPQYIFEHVDESNFNARPFTEQALASVNAFPKT